MPKTNKRSRRRSMRRKTYRRRHSKKGGASTSQKIVMPDSSFGRFVGSPENTDNTWHRI